MAIHQHTYTSSGTIAPSGMKHGDHYRDELTSREYIYNGTVLVPIPTVGDYIAPGFVDNITIAPSSILSGGAALNDFLKWDGTNWVPSVVTGVPGSPGPGVNTGGTTGQALVKLSGTDYHTGWATLQPLISVGTNKILTTDGSGNIIAHSTVDTSELTFVNGVSANIQTQIDSKQPNISVGNNKLLVTNGSGIVSGHAFVDIDELTFIDGVSANVQTQINSINSTLNVGNNKVLITNGSGIISGHASVDTTELSYLDTVSGNIQTQLNTKEPTITGAVSTVTTSNLNNNIVVVSNSSGKISNSNISTTELSSLSGITGNIENRLNNIQQVLASGPITDGGLSFKVSIPESDAKRIQVNFRGLYNTNASTAADIDVAFNFTENGGGTSRHLCGSASDSSILTSTAVTAGSLTDVSVTFDTDRKPIYVHPTKTDLTTIASRTWNDIAFGNGVFIAVGKNTTDDGAITRSDDNGITWTSSILHTTGAVGFEWKRIIFSSTAQKWFIYGNQGTMAYSLDPLGVNFTVLTNKTAYFNTLEKLVYNPNEHKIVIIGAGVSGGNKFHVSTDGENFTTYENNLGSGFSSFPDDDGLLILPGNKYLFARTGDYETTYITDENFGLLTAVATGFRRPNNITQGETPNTYYIAVETETNFDNNMYKFVGDITTQPLKAAWSVCIYGISVFNTSVFNVSNSPLMISFSGSYNAVNVSFGTTAGTTVTGFTSVKSFTYGNGVIIVCNEISAASTVELSRITLSPASRQLYANYTSATKTTALATGEFTLGSATITPLTIEATDKITDVTISMVGVLLQAYGNYEIIKIY